jgi:hypothetical protein
MLRTRSSRRGRRGAVSVEFALIAPVMVLIMVGMVEASRLIDTQMIMASAAREGARLASMDRAGLAPGTSTNDKITADIKNFLEASGLSPDDVEVSITSPDDPDETLDLDDPDNSQELFRLSVEVPFSAALGAVPDVEDDRGLAASVVFRNGRVNE